MLSFLWGQSLPQEATAMTPFNSALAQRIRGSVNQWWQDRKYECSHCFQCDGEVELSDQFCPNCGQRNPARLSALAAAFVVGGMLLLAVALWLLALLF